jgi:NAD(P)-dependent dehydrogenase (short-subunit alcohol dehydrogenase family)
MIKCLTLIATGMGKGVAVDLAKKGWKVVIADVNAIEGKRTANEVGGDFYQLDVRSWSGQYQVFEETFKKYQRIDFGAWVYLLLLWQLLMLPSLRQCRDP